MNIHSGNRPFKCFCGKAFGQSSNYRAHMRVHLNDRPYKCDEPGCSKSFVQAINLTLHKRVHTGEKPFKCEVCGREFRRKSQCMAHTRVHNNIRPYTCSQCPRQFTHRTHLVKKTNKKHPNIAMILIKRSTFQFILEYTREIAHNGAAVQVHGMYKSIHVQTSVGSSPTHAQR